MIIDRSRIRASIGQAIRKMDPDVQMLPPESAHRGDGPAQGLAVSLAQGPSGLMSSPPASRASRLPLDIEHRGWQGFGITA